MRCTLHSQSRTGNRAEPSDHSFWSEGSDKRPSAQYLRPNIQPIYQLQLLVNWMKIRTNQTQGSEFEVNVRTRRKHFAPRTASGVQVSRQWVEICRASFPLINGLLPENECTYGNRVELSSICFLGENSNKGVSGQHL